MPNQPIRRQAGQTVDEMAAQMAGSRENNRLYAPKKGNYKEISDELKREALSNAIDQQLDLLQAARERGHINLDNMEEVEVTAANYMLSCKAASVFPTMLGFSAACGYSRKHLYNYISTKHTETARYLDMLRSSWNAVIAEMALARQCSESVSIFLLKNSGQDMTDKAEIDMTARPAEPLGERKTMEELEEYLRVIDDMANIEEEGAEP